jgi:peptidoglycan/LPS O-acetylase OafA/YrhL
VIDDPERSGIPRKSLTSHPLRTDIQALRAVAVMSVVLFHLWPNRLPGGFVGVDVFFVISGYLITAHLVREVEHTGRLRLGRFWAARARRLLPASLLTLLATAVAVMLIVPRSLWDQFLSEVIASASYVQNWLLAANSVDYLAAENVPSPVQHFWSLSVEEQFYVAVPLLLCLAIGVGKVVAAPRLHLVAGVLSAVTVASITYCLYLTSINPGVAYFSTFTRMWEFGLGGLASFAAPAVAGLARGRAVAHAAATLGGGLAIVVSFFMIDSRTPFPGYAAMLPVLGTFAVVRWGGSTFATALGSLQPAAELGRISYALYLWHWPLIILVPFITLRDLGTTDKLIILVLAISISSASTRLVEEPMRFSVARKARPRVVLLAVVVAMVPILFVTAAGKAAVENDRAGHLAEAARVLEQSPDCLGAESRDPAHPHCDDVSFRSIVPAPAAALYDRTPHKGCNIGVNEAGLSSCSVGPATGYSLHLAAVGDSHNRTLMPAYLWMAERYNWRIDVIGRPGCYWTTAQQDREYRPLHQRELCDRWRADLGMRLDGGGYDAVLTTHATADSIEPRDGLTYEETAVQGMVEAWTTQTPDDVPVIAILDNPQAEESNTPCVERFGATDPHRCAASREWALRRFDGSAEAVAQVDKASLVDMTPFFCDARTCPSVIGGVMVYRDHTHLTATYVASLAPYISRAVITALRNHRVL